MSMKVFDFKCGDCNHFYEAFVRNDDTPKCKSCGSSDNQVKQLGVGHVFATSNDQPQTHKDLQNYLGDGKYVPGYQR